MRYDKTSGHFMPIESRRKQNHMMVRYKVDEANHRVLQEMLNKAEGDRIEGVEWFKVLPGLSQNKGVDKESTADTGVAPAKKPNIVHCKQKELDSPGNGAGHNIGIE